MQHDPSLLFHIENDLSIKHNIAQAHTDIVGALLAAIEKHKSTIEPYPS